ncbi:hypothetical protein WAF17_10625 [Bernardetia sp. ABR2-2B]|uniref:hypothetical protein n=1 Tax=Bernardetia sp. ABR2-2B TaxID=3127472 RepID=UPI0030D5F5D8
MTKDKESKKEQIWMTIFTVIPVVLFMNVGEYFTDDSKMKILYSAVFGGLSGGIGAGLFLLFKNKSSLIKIIALISFISIFAVFIRAIYIYSFPEKEVLIEEEVLITCSVCGYKTLTKDDKLCGECLVELTESEMTEEGYSSMEEFIKEEQIIFFSSDSLVDTVDFYNPKISEYEYEKDLNWTPLVSKDSVLKFNKEYVNFKENYSLDVE